LIVDISLRLKGTAFHASRAGTAENEAVWIFDALERKKLLPYRSIRKLSDLPALCLYYSYRVLYPLTVRMAMARMLSAWIRVNQRRPKHAKEILSEPSAQRYRDFNVRGIVMLPPPLAPSAIAEINSYLADQPVVGPNAEAVTVDQLPSGATFASYSLSTVLACPHVLELANRPEIIAFVTRYMGCMPTLSEIGIRWSLVKPTEGKSVQRFHRDPADWRSVKLYIYLSDVDEGAGPHVYVVGSHKISGGMRSPTISDEVVEKIYGGEALQIVEGARGTCFMTDVHGIHKGTPPRDKPRLLLQIQYTLLPVFTFRYLPIPMPLPVGADPYVNRLIVSTPQ
jgi:hypothetical protein